MKCSWCGAEYEPDDTDGRSRIFCSKKCMDEAKADYLHDLYRDEGRPVSGLSTRGSK